MQILKDYVPKIPRKSNQNAKFWIFPALSLPALPSICPISSKFHSSAVSHSDLSSCRPVFFFFSFLISSVYRATTTIHTGGEGRRRQNRIFSFRLRTQSILGDNFDSGGSVTAPLIGSGPSWRPGHGVEPTEKNFFLSPPSHTHWEFFFLHNFRFEAIADWLATLNGGRAPPKGPNRPAKHSPVSRNLRFVWAKIQKNPKSKIFFSLLYLDDCSNGFNTKKILFFLYNIWHRVSLFCCLGCAVVLGLQSACGGVSAHLVCETIVLVWQWLCIRGARGTQEGLGIQCIGQTFAQCGKNFKFWVKFVFFTLKVQQKTAEWLREVQKKSKILT